MAREAQKRPFSFVRAGALAARLDVDPWEARICLACLSFVVFPLTDGDEREAMTWMRRMTPDLWAEGRPATTVYATPRRRWPTWR